MYACMKYMFKKKTNKKGVILIPGVVVSNGGCRFGVWIHITDIGS